VFFAYVGVEEVHDGATQPMQDEPMNTDTNERDEVEQLEDANAQLEETEPDQTNGLASVLELLESSLHPRKFHGLVKVCRIMMHKIKPDDTRFRRIVSTNTCAHENIFVHGDDALEMMRVIGFEESRFEKDGRQHRAFTFPPDGCMTTAQLAVVDGALCRAIQAVKRLVPPESSDVAPTSSRADGTGVPPAPTRIAQARPDGVAPSVIPRTRANGVPTTSGVNRATTVVGSAASAPNNRGSRATANLNRTIPGRGRQNRIKYDRYGDGPPDGDGLTLRDHWFLKYTWLEVYECNGEQLVRCKYCHTYPALHGKNELALGKVLLKKLRKDTITNHCCNNKTKPSQQALDHRKCCDKYAQEHGASSAPLAMNALQLSLVEKEEVICRLIVSAYYLVKTNTAISSMRDLCTTQKKNGTACLSPKHIFALRIIV
jgi:hypothetical protein